MRVLFAGATGVIGRQAVPVLTAASHQVIGLARRPGRLGAYDGLVAADALDRAAVARAVGRPAPDVIVHMLTAVPDPVDPRHLARDMALTNRLRAKGTANLVAAAKGIRFIAQGVAYAYGPAGSAVNDEDAPVAGPAGPVRPRDGRVGLRAPGHLGRRAGAAAGPPLRPGLQLRPRRRPRPDAPRRHAPADQQQRRDVLLHPRRSHPPILAAIDHPTARGCSTSSTTTHPGPRLAARDGGHARRPGPRHVPAWLARLLVGEWGVAYMTGLAGAANTRAATGCTGSPPTAAGGTA